MRRISPQDIEAVRQSGLFDEQWYLEHYPDVKALGMDPVEHYLWIGERLGRRQSSSATAPAPGSAPPRAVNSLYGAMDSSARDGPAVVFPEHDQPEISVIIPVYNQLNYTLECLRSLLADSQAPAFEVIVMDDCSSDATPDVLIGIPGLRFFRNERNLGFNRSCNRGAELARGQYLVFLNNDTRVHPGWLSALRRTFDEHTKVGLAGSKLIFGDGRLQEAGGVIWEDGSGWNWGRLQDAHHPRYNFVRDVDYLSGASLMVPRQLFLDLGKFNDQLENSYYEDTWLAFAAREAGYRVLYQPQSVVTHYEGITSGVDESGGTKRYQIMNRQVFFERWKNTLATHLPNGTSLEIASDRRLAGHILVVDACTPTPDQDSGSIDMFNLIRILRNLNYRVHFIPQTNFAFWGKYTESLQAMGVECIYAPFYGTIRQFLTDRGDMFSHVIMARTPIAAAVFDDIVALAPRARRIFYTVDMHGLREIREAEVLRDAAMLAKANETLRRERELVSRSDIAIVLSEYEASFLRQRGHANIEVLPLIRDYSRPIDIPPFEQRRDVLFIGGFQHTPNLDAVRWLYDEIWPSVRALVSERGIPPIRLKVVGSNMPDWIRNEAPEDADVLGYIENLDALFAGIRLTIAPLRFGAGLKGKVATSLGYGVPVIGTTTAFEGMAKIENYSPWRMGNGANKLASSVLLMYSEQSTWTDCSKFGLSYVREMYSSNVIQEQIGTIFSNIELKQHL